MVIIHSVFTILNKYGGHANYDHYDYFDDGLNRYGDYGSIEIINFFILGGSSAFVANLFPFS